MYDKENLLQIVSLAEEVSSSMGHTHSRGVMTMALVGGIFAVVFCVVVMMVFV